jgi:membrane-associated phospholipid phosphatase
MYFILNVPHISVNVLRTFIDDQIPRLPIFSIIYLAFLPWFWGVVVYSWLKNRSFRQLAYSVIIVNLIAFGVYLFFQTHVPRESVMGNDFLSGMLRFIYSYDQPYNAFPSLHVALSSVIATYFVCMKSKCSWAFVAIALLISISTLFVKQHFIVDVLSGVVLGGVVTWLVFKTFQNKIPQSLQEL